MHAIPSEIYPYEAETYGVTIRVLPEYLDDRSEPDQRQYFWRYTIEIENGADQEIQLLRRHWVITDAVGRRQEVRGDGVVGEQPYISPGDRYIYASGCPLNEPSGLMMGSFVMCRDDGEEFQVTVPAFSLDSPHDRAQLN